MIATALGLAACAEGFTQEAAVESFATANPDATSAEAECVVDALVAQYGLEELEQELANEPPFPSFTNAQFRASFDCGMTEPVIEQLVPQVVASGVADEHAECVATELVATITDDELDALTGGPAAETFGGRYLEAAESCGALNS
ncbi:MAG: hypothetical protein AAF467_16935 [Actinomycetota bacterium]